MNTLSVAPGESQAVVQYLRSLTAEQKDVALAELMREAVEVNGDRFLLPVTGPAGEPLGVFVPQARASSVLKVYIPNLTPEQRAETDAALADLSRTFDMREYLDELSRAELG